MPNTEKRRDMNFRLQASQMIEYDIPNVFAWFIVVVCMFRRPKCDFHSGKENKEKKMGIYTYMSMCVYRIFHNSVVNRGDMCQGYESVSASMSD